VAPDRAEPTTPHPGRPDDETNPPGDGASHPRAGRSSTFEGEGKGGPIPVAKGDPAPRRRADPIRDQSELASTTSPLARVPMAQYVWRLIVDLMNRTLPSPIRKLAPPEWLLLAFM
jgi:hypothetical protein